MIRPTGIESIRAIQAALAETIVPELKSPFAQDAAGTLQMLLESIAGEWDTAAEYLRADNGTLCSLLADSRSALQKAASRNESLGPLVTEIESRLREKQDKSLALTSLTSRNRALRATLESILVMVEDQVGQAGREELQAVRKDIFAHLRDVATRGWSFWDVSSFRGRMTALRSAAADDARATRKVE